MTKGGDYKVFLFCEKCGLICNKKTSQHPCPACATPLSVVPSEYLSPSGTMFASQELRKEFEKIIQQGDKFDQEAQLNRELILKHKDEEHKAVIEKKLEEYNESRVKFTCPICHSENLSKISNVGKIVKVGVFGILGAGDIGKKYRCNSCGYRF